MNTTVISYLRIQPDRQCAGCKEWFTPRPEAINQKYCKPKCVAKRGEK